MRSRAIMVACIDSHTSPVFDCRGDEGTLLVSGEVGEATIDLLLSGPDGSDVLPLCHGPNEFPAGWKRFSVRKLVVPGAQGVPTTVKLLSR